MNPFSQATTPPLTCPATGLPALGYWTGSEAELLTDPASIRSVLDDIRQPVYVVDNDGTLALATGGAAQIGGLDNGTGALPLVGFVGPMRPEQLGDPSFCADHGIRFPYMAGSMANGIASVELVEAVSRSGMLASFGAAGRSVAQIEEAIDHITRHLGERPYCFNLIHSPNEPALEAAVVDLYLRRGIRRVEASAYLDLTLPVVRYRAAGIHRDAQGRIVTPNHVIAKASRVEVATKWFSPPPEAMLAKLVKAGELTAEQAELAARIPVAQDLTAEADSGGHTDNRPAITLIPTLMALRDRLQAEYGYEVPLRVGAAGGIATPASAAAAFAMGAAYVLTGSINQACVESGSSDRVRQMLAETQQADVIMAPAADMFEMGVKLQVLKRGTMFAMRASKLYELYRAYGSLDELPPADRQMIEKTIFRETCDSVWERTERFFRERDPAQVERAQRDPKHKMALVFRWYLGLSSRWANQGEPTRQIDYQVWCGPAMGAFNEWVKGSFLEQPAARRVAIVGLNLLYGAAVVTRINMLRNQGVRLAAELTHVVPREASQLEELLN